MMLRGNALLSQRSGTAQRGASLAANGAMDWAPLAQCWGSERVYGRQNNCGGRGGRGDGADGLRTSHRRACTAEGWWMCGRPGAVDVDPEEGIVMLAPG